MGAFLQTYGVWIVFGIAIILMFRMHGGGGMHGMHSGGAPSARDDDQRLNQSYPPAVEPYDQDGAFDRPVAGSLGSIAPLDPRLAPPPARETTTDSSDGSDTAHHARQQRHGGC